MQIDVRGVLGNEYWVVSKGGTAANQQGFLGKMTAGWSWWFRVVSLVVLIFCLNKTINYIDI